MAFPPPLGVAPAQPPWRMLGECVLAWVPVPAGLRSLLPDGVRPLPGRAALVAVSYTDSPVGPFLELSLGLPARIGLRPGLCVVFQELSEPEARRAYRSVWGLPAGLGSLSWRAEGAERVMRSDDIGLEVRGVPVGPSFPAVVPIRSVQRRVDGPVVLPRRFLALVRLARTIVTFEPDAGSRVEQRAGVDVFSTVAGAHPGAVMSGVRIVARPARQPAGLWSSLRAPAHAPDPAF